MADLERDILNTSDDWDDGKLGADEQFVVKSTHTSDDDINDALSLQPISIRLQKGLIENLKTIAELNGLGYQPLIRQALTRFVECEMKQIANEALSRQRKQQEAAMRVELEQHQDQRKIA
jgi:hypothetical protein